MNAAMVCGPSSWITSSIIASEEAADSHPRGLLLNRADHALVAMADVHAHQLAVEVDETLALRRPEVDALRACDRDGIDLRLRRPLVQRVASCQCDDLVAAHRLYSFGRH